MKFERIEMNREDINWKWEERRKRNGWGWLFEIMIEYDIGKIEKFIKKYNIEIINEKLGTIKISGDSLDVLFDITMTPMEDWLYIIINKKQTQELNPGLYFNLFLQ